MNQCDGCMAKIPLVGGVHVDSSASTLMVCQRRRYEPAILRCVKLRKDGSEDPKFELVYADKIKMLFKADNVAEAGQIARHHLNVNGFNNVSIEWGKDNLEV